MTSELNSPGSLNQPPVINSTMGEILTGISNSLNSSTQSPDVKPTMGEIITDTSNSQGSLIQSPVVDSLNTRLSEIIAKIKTINAELQNLKNSHRPFQSYWQTQVLRSYLKSVYNPNGDKTLEYMRKCNELSGLIAAKENCLTMITVYKHSNP